MIRYEPLHGRLVIEDEDLAGLPRHIPGPERLRALSKGQKESIFSGGGNEYSIGGRDTDVSQLAASVANLVREYFPINGVPAELAEQVKVLGVLAAFTERQIMLVLDGLADAESGARS